MMTPADGYTPRMQMYLFGGKGARYLEVTAPAAIAGQYEGQTGSFGAPTFDVTARSSPPRRPALHGAHQRRGGVRQDRPGGSRHCAFADKARFAQAAGAAGVVIRNVGASQAFGGLGGADASVTIPVLLVDHATGALPSDGAARHRRHRPDVPRAVVMRDGTLDNLIVAHEWGHYISNRLVGDASGLDSTQAGGLGEGWGDTHALLLAVREEDAAVAANADFAGVYGAGRLGRGRQRRAGRRQRGLLLRHPPVALLDRHVAGTRSPSGTSPTARRLLPEGSTIPVSGDGASRTPRSTTPARSGPPCSGSATRPAARTLGATPRLTFAEARDQWKDYLVASYKLTPLNPTFLEARDALLAAAAATDRQRLQPVRQAFAKRGAGVGRGRPGQVALPRQQPGGGELLRRSAPRGGERHLRPVGLELQRRRRLPGHR